MCKEISFLVLLTTFSWIGFQPSLHGDEVSLRTMMEAGWAKTGSGLASAKAQFETLSQAGPNSKNELAMALILLRHHRYAESQKILDALLRREPQNVNAWKATIWLSVLTKNYQSALSRMEQFAAQVAKLPAEASETRETEEAVKLVGSLFGYLTGPQSKAVPLDMRNAVESSVLDAWKLHLQLTFSEARQGVLARYVALVQETEETKTEEGIARAQQQQQFQNAVQQERAQLDEQQRRIEQTRVQQADQQAQKREALDKAARPVNAETADIQARAIIIRRELDIADREIFRLEDLLAIENDPIVRNSILFDIERWQRLRSRYETDWLVLQRQAAGNTQAQWDLASRRQDLQRQENAQLGELGAKQDRLAANQKQLDIALRRQARQKPTKSGKLRTQQSRLTSLNHFVPFPLDFEKERLLQVLP